MQEMKSIVRRLGVGLLSLLLFASTALSLALLLQPQKTHAASTFAYTDNTDSCNLPDEVTSIAIIETSSDPGSGNPSYIWCPASGSGYQFARNGIVDARIVVNADSPEQGLFRTGSLDTGTPITIGNTTVFTQAINSENPDSADDSSCESKSGVMGWILCPTVTALDSTLSWIDTQVHRLLEVDKDKYTNEGLHAAWKQIRNISYAILIPVMLVMVIGTALGFDIFSAYTVKKALPRLVLATIFIALSWHITVFLVGFFNVVGMGALGLITSPFKSQVPPSCVEGALNLACLYDAPTVTGGGASGAAGGVLHYILNIPMMVASILGPIIILIFFGTTLLLAIGTGFLVLLARQMFILALMVFAPLAIIAWIFPGNDKLWSFWWSTFSKLLLMFPLIMVLIGVGRVFALIINETGGSGLDGAVLVPIMKLLAYMLPYAFIPFTFKFAGGVFGNLAGFVNDKEKGLFDRARQTRAEKFKRAGENRFFNPNSRLGKFNNAMGWVGDPKNSARIALGTSGGRAVMGKVMQGAFEHTQKLSEILSRSGMNDVALRGLSTGLEGYDQHGNRKSIRAWNGTNRDLNRLSSEMANLYNEQGDVDENARLGAKQLRDNAGFMLSYYRSEDYGRASIKGAAGLALAQQGFITPGDIAKLSNELDGGTYDEAGNYIAPKHASGLGSMFKTTAELMGARGGALTKPGYSVQLDDSGSFTEGSFATRVAQATRIGTQDWGGAKGKQIDDNYTEAITGILAGTVNEAGRLVVERKDAGGNIIETAEIDPGLQQTMRETLLQTYASYTAPDIRNRIRKQLINAERARGNSEEAAVQIVNNELSRYVRGMNEDELRIRGGQQEE